MRISTSMIFDAGVSAMNQQTASLLHTQQQISSGRRILTPADDPVAAAQALVVQQSVDINDQYQTNQNNAKSALGLEDSQLDSANTLLVRMRTLAVQAGNTTLTAADRKSIASELRAEYDQLLSMANATDGTGQYLFAGYSGNTIPFGGAVDYLNAGHEITYQGDSGQRTLQISASRMLPVSDSGSDVFMRIANGNGYFVTGYNTAFNPTGNTGTAMIDTGSVTDPAKWNSATNSKNLQVRFWVDTAGAAGPANRTYYDLVDATTGNSLFTGTASTTGAGGTYTHAYTSGQPITFSGLAAAYNPPSNDFGATVTVSGTPASGDAFSLTASTSQSVFKTIASLIGTLEGSVTGDAGVAKYSMDIGSALTNLDQGYQNILRTRSAIGSRLSELTTVGNVSTSLDTQYKQTLSNLEDVDMTKAISDLTKNQMGLQAAQQSYSKIAQLSLFNYL